jgi:large subunit ribosomal protein L1
MEKYTPIEAVKYLRENSEKRKFSQTFDMIVVLKNIDMKKPENKITKDIMLPNGRGKELKVGFISESGEIRKSTIEEMLTNKKKAKQFSKNYDMFVCEASLMPLVGKILGKYLAPKGKMPLILPPGKDPKNVINDAQRTVRIKLRDAPMMQICVGSEGMSDEQVKENVERALEDIKKALPPKAMLKSALLKLTMSKPVKIGV